MQRDENGRFRTFTAEELIDRTVRDAGDALRRGYAALDAHGRGELSRGGLQLAVERARRARRRVDAAIADAETEVERLRGTP